MKIFFVLLSVFFSYSAISQTFDVTEMLSKCGRPKLNASGFHTLTKKKASSDKDFSQTRGFLNYRQGIDEGCTYAFSLATEYNQFNGLGSYNDTSTFISPRVGLNYKDLYGDYLVMAGLSAVYRVEAQSGVHTILPMTYVIATKAERTRTRWIYGAAVADPYGRLMPFPILGVTQKWSKKWSTRFILPLAITSTYKIKRGTSLSILAVPAGFQSSLENRGRFNSGKQELQARFRAYKLGASYMKRERSWSWNLESGVLVGRRYQIYDGTHRIAEEKAKGSLYAQAGIGYNF